MITEKNAEDKTQKSFSDISKAELTQNPEITSLKALKRPPDSKMDKDSKLLDNHNDTKNEIDNMLDKALDQIEKENLPLTYEVYSG